MKRALERLQAAADYLKEQRPAVGCEKRSNANSAVKTTRKENAASKTIAATNPNNPKQKKKKRKKDGKENTKDKSKKGKDKKKGKNKKNPDWREAHF